MRSCQIYPVTIKQNFLIEALEPHQITNCNILIYFDFGPTIFLPITQEYKNNQWKNMGREPSSVAFVWCSPKIIPFLFCDWHTSQDCVPYFATSNRFNWQPETQWQRPSLSTPIILEVDRRAIPFPVWGSQINLEHVRNTSRVRYIQEFDSRGSA